MKSMASVSKILKVRSTRQKKEVEYRQQSNAALQLLFNSQNIEDGLPLKPVCKYPLKQVPSRHLYRDHREAILCLILPLMEI